MALKLLALRSQFLCLGEASLSPEPHLRPLDSFYLKKKIIFQIFLPNYFGKALGDDKQSVLKRKPPPPQKRGRLDLEKRMWDKIAFRQVGGKAL